jgi:hypothetical protein
MSADVTTQRTPVAGIPGRLRPHAALRRGMLTAPARVDVGDIPAAV